MSHFLRITVLFLGFAQIYLIGAEKEEPLNLNTRDLKASYAFGMDIGKTIKNISDKFGFDLDLKVFFQGLKDQFVGEKTLLTQDEARKAKVVVVEEYNKKKWAQGEKNKKDNEKFFSDNCKKKGVITKSSGLQYMILKQGEGAAPDKNDIVNVHYRGFLINGTEFINTYKHKQPGIVKLSNAIQGWREALPLMKIGGKYRIFLPSDLAYGEKSRGSKIGPHSALIYDIELLGIEKVEKDPEKIKPSEKYKKDKTVTENVQDSESKTKQ